MPFDSMRQSRLAFAKPSKFGGMKKVKEFAHKTDYDHLPERVSKPPKRKKPSMPKRKAMY